QAISTRVGAVTKCGLEDLVRRRYGKIAALFVLFSVVLVNVLTFAADLEGGGAALKLLSGVDYRLWVVPLAALSLMLLILNSFRKLERILIYIPLAFLSYIIAAVLARPDWGAVLRDSLLPHFHSGSAYSAGAIALLGTTLTAYAYVWQELETSEDAPPLRRLGLVQVDATIGAVCAGITFWFITIATGATLGVHHRTVETADQAAQALAPLAGHFASTLFGVGLLGSALLALPVLLATSAYIVTEMFGWRGKLDAKFFQARRFYWIMIVICIIGCAIALAGVQPIRLLFISSIAGGIATPISLVYLLLTACDERVVKEYGLPLWLRIGGWATTAIVTIAAAIFLYQTFV
ncbi:MAG TPA: divalent metal cation transporter, partial [Candidatus Baltobacteraceae bacterium]|nr:divalent metal cation transporter [Candidatus Baltobacteraceae bacterium]